MDDFFLISLLVLLVSGRCMPASRSAFRIHILVYLSDAISLQLYVDTAQIELTIGGSRHGT